ncbi:methyl-accepting chemotaxis protein [Sagittula sp. SSi028]|uniref:methyl-accepting chemotaxis protein n=1 Tax=Sagittula sp. SSi028 TaxID=3400636 RepID=UPI003AF7EDC4
MPFFRKTTYDQPIERRYERPDLLDMIDATQAVIHFRPDGEILFANKNFLDALGYTASEVEGSHHSMFVDDEYRASEEYADFWKRLGSGEPFTNQYKRITKNGDPIYIHATYCPVRDDAGVIRRVIKIASDITARQMVIDRISGALTALSHGDLSQRIHGEMDRDLEILAQSYNAAIEQLASLVSKVKNVSTTVYASSQGISTTATNLSRRTETQAATLEETAAAIEQLTSNAQSAAENATEVRGMANSTSQTAENGRKLVASLTEAMERIESSSDQIGQIISVIEGIAFQTNLLALNAGVEAARAGESGRGFAVVASEVRGLAQRSSESASEIKSLIQTSSQNVKAGSDLVNRASHEFEAVFEGITGISSNVEHIASNLQMQSDVLREINSSVAQLDTVTQENAATVNDISGSGKELEQASGTLVGEVSYFAITPEAAPAMELYHDDMRASG